MRRISKYSGRKKPTVVIIKHAKYLRSNDFPRVRAMTQQFRRMEDQIDIQRDRYGMIAMHLADECDNSLKLHHIIIKLRKQLCDLNVKPEA